MRVADTVEQALAIIRAPDGQPEPAPAGGGSVE